MGKAGALKLSVPKQSNANRMRSRSFRESSQQNQGENSPLLGRPKSSEVIHTIVSPLFSQSQQEALFSASTEEKPLSPTNSFRKKIRTVLKTALSSPVTPTSEKGSVGVGSPSSPPPFVTPVERASVKQVPRVMNEIQAFLENYEQVSQFSPTHDKQVHQDTEYIERYHGRAKELLEKIDNIQKNLPAPVPFEEPVIKEQDTQTIAQLQRLYGHLSHNLEFAQYSETTSRLADSIYPIRQPFIDENPQGTYRKRPYFLTMSDKDKEKYTERLKTLEGYILFLGQEKFEPCLDRQKLDLPVLLERVQYDLMTCDHERGKAFKEVAKSYEVLSQYLGGHMNKGLDSGTKKIYVKHFSELKQKMEDYHLPKTGLWKNINRRLKALES